MDNKFELIEKIVKDEKSYTLPIIREKILNVNNQFITKDLSFGLKAFLDDFFNKGFSKNSKKIDFTKIEIYEQHGLFLDLFNKLCSKKSEINQFDIISLKENSNYIYTDYEPTHDWDNVYGDLKSDILYGIKQIVEPSECMNNCIKPRYKSSMNIFNFEQYIIHSVSTGYSNLAFISGISWFAKELKDYKVNLNYSFQYDVEYTYLEMLYEVFKVLTDINEDLAQVTFRTNHTGMIFVSLKKADENKQHFVYELEAKDISELYQILKGTNQNTFINFLSQNNLYFSYKNNFLSCSKISNKKVFSINDLFINNFNTLDMNYIMANINHNLNIVDLAYYAIKMFLPSEEDIKKEFINLITEDKLKLFIAIFSIKKNVDYSNYAIDDNDVAKYYGTTKNNIFETYKKKKVAQYELLRLGITCKIYGITEEDLLELVRNYRLKRIDKD